MMSRPQSPSSAHGHRPRMWRALLLAGLVTAMASQIVQAQAEQVRRRGRYLRTDILRTEEKPFFSCSLAASASSCPVLQFRHQQLITHHEVRVYEVVVEEKGYDEEMDRDAIVYRIVPGEEMRGETLTRQNVRDTGPFGDTVFLVGKRAFHTDKEGLAVDHEQRLLAPFDDMTCSTCDVTVSHPDYGEVILKLSRYLTRRWSDEERTVRATLTQTDVLLGLGRDFEPVSPSSHDALDVTVTIPPRIRAGDTVEITVTATNAGPRPVSCLIGRLFSRQAWFSGLNLYLGNIPAGESREFRRRIRIPATTQPQTVYATLGLWDILGAIRGGARRIAVRVDAAAETVEPLTESGVGAQGR